MRNHCSLTHPLAVPLPNHISGSSKLFVALILNFSLTLDLSCWLSLLNTSIPESMEKNYQKELFATSPSLGSTLKGLGWSDSPMKTLECSKPPRGLQVHQKAHRELQDTLKEKQCLPGHKSQVFGCKKHQAKEF